MIEELYWNIYLKIFIIPLHQVNVVYNIKHNLFIFNPQMPSAHKSARIAKISILKLEGIMKKNFYESSDYESVNEKTYR